MKHSLAFKGDVLFYNDQAAIAKRGDMIGIIVDFTPEDTQILHIASYKECQKSMERWTNFYYQIEKKDVERSLGIPIIYFIESCDPVIARINEAFAKNSSMAVWELRDEVMKWKKHNLFNTRITTPLMEAGESSKA